VSDFSPRHGKGLGGALEREKGVFVGERGGVARRDGVDGCLRAGQRALDVRADMLRCELRPTDFEGGIEKGMFGGRRGRGCAG
jgi:hypothetical protein